MSQITARIAAAVARAPIAQQVSRVHKTRPSRNVFEVFRSWQLTCTWSTWTRSNRLIKATEGYFPTPLWPSISVLKFKRSYCCLQLNCPPCLKMANLRFKLSFSFRSPSNPPPWAWWPRSCRRPPPLRPPAPLPPKSPPSSKRGSSDLPPR